MSFIKFLFVILIVLPIGVVLYFLLRKLVDEYNAAMKKSQELEMRRKEEVQAPVQRDYRRDNPRYYAYRKKMEQRQDRAAEREGQDFPAEGQENSQDFRRPQRGKYQMETEDAAGAESGKRLAHSKRSKRKRRKERKNRKKDREKDKNQQR